jgi:NAD(P)-dependent dehydrogenase (short-subunit alcohol dehydrogenase family)
MGDLTGKTAVITGGAGGLGRAIGRALGREGAEVALVDLKDSDKAVRPEKAAHQRLAEAVAEVGEMAPRVIGLQADVTVEADCQNMTDQLLDQLGKIDIFISNAGLATSGNAWELTEEEWDWVHNANLKGFFLSTKYVIPHMIARRYGKIVVTSSRNGLRVEKGYAHYNAAKAGAIHYAKSLALELGPYDINVNAVCPTQMTDRTNPPRDRPNPYWQQVTGKENPTWEEFDRASGADNLFEDRGQPDFSEVAEGVSWLVSDKSSLVTGLALPMDAGWIVKRGG